VPDRPHDLPSSMESDLVGQLRQQLAKSEQAAQRWRSIIEGPFDFVMIVDTAATIMYINRVSFGYRKEDIVGHASIFDFIAEEQHETIRNTIKSVFETGKPASYEAFLPEPAGHWFESLVTPFEQDEKGIYTVSIQAHDTTDQRDIESNLEESQNRFEQLAENIADCFYLFDTVKNQMVYVSPTVETILGIPADVFLRDPMAWMTPIHPEDYQSCLDGYRQLVSGDYSFGIPVEYRVQLGSDIRWVQHRAFPVRNENQKIVRIAGIVSDITDRVMAANELQVAQARYRNLLETLPVISYVVDPEQEQPMQYVSPQIEWKLGYTQEEWTSDSELWESRIHPDDLPAVRLARDEFMSSGAPLDITYRLLAKDNAAISVREEANLVSREGAKAPHIHGVLLDVSETVDARVAQRRAQEASLQLVQVQENERRHLARELHDEIGQSLTMLRLLMEMAETGDPLVRAEKLALAHSSVQDLMSKVHALALDLRPGMLDDLGLLPSLVWLTDRLNNQTQLSVQFEHDGIVDACLSDEVATCVYRIVQEALTNCVRHAAADTVQVHVWMTGTSLNLQVDDDGCGFDVASVLEGSGRAGLKGIRERTTAIGGEFELDSRPGEGCRLLVHVPREGSHARGY